MDQLALGLIIALVPLILAGLAYGTYMQPQLARKALVVLVVLDLVYFSGIYSAEMGARKGYTTALAAIADDSTLAYNPMDELSITRLDSLRIYIHVRSEINNVVYENILYEQQQDLEKTKSIRNYCYVAFGIIALFYLLSFLFETMRISRKMNLPNKDDAAFRMRGDKRF